MTSSNGDDTAPSGDAKATGAKNPPPFFVVGFQRSGTTMLRLMLNSHPNCAVPFESGFVTAFFDSSDDYGDLGVLDNRRRLLDDILGCSWVARGKLIEDPNSVLEYPIASYADMVDAIFTEYAKRREKTRWGDKTPGYITEIDILMKLFPDCRILHLVRDGRDVALSFRRISWGSANIPRVAQDWSWSNVLASKMGALLGDQYLEVRYEDLVLNTEPTLRLVCAFLGEPYDEAMLGYHVDGGAEIPADSAQWHESSVKLPDRDKVYEWKRVMSVADRIIFEEVAGDALELFGYKRENRSRTLGSRLRSLHYALVRRW